MCLIKKNCKEAALLDTEIADSEVVDEEEFRQWWRDEKRGTKRAAEGSNNVTLQPK